jgi:hypothetical protein
LACHILDIKLFNPDFAYHHQGDVMKVRDVIEMLSELSGPSRQLDGDIAKIVGWQKKTERRPEKQDGNIIEIGVWYKPDGSEARKVPFYTASVQSAYDLVRELAPEVPAACALMSGGGRVQVDGMDTIFARTLPIALCISALTIVERLGLDGVDDQ